MTSTRRLTALRAARVFDGTRLVADPTVVLDGSRVVAAGVGAPGLDVVDLGDVTVLPGLVDPHVHLTFDAGPDPIGALVTRTPGEVLAAMAEAAAATLRQGVTTVRDLGDRDYLSLALRARPGLPTIVAAGPPVTTEGGHRHILGGATAATEPALRAAVRTRAERGCEVVKVMASGGTHHHAPRFGVAELRVVVDEAHRHGLPVTAHAHATAAIAAAVAAGVDGIEHVTFRAPAGVDDRPDLLAAIVERRVAVGATLGVAPAVALPPVVTAYARLVREGAVVVAGTDAGTGPAKAHSPLPHALPQLVALGMSPLDALRSMTSVAAGVCGLAARKGRLAPGFDADLLVVGGDPPHRAGRTA